MKLKLIRSANVLNPSFHPSFILFFAIIAVGSLRSKFRPDFVFSGLVLFLIYCIVYPAFNSPKYIEFCDHCICYVSPKTLLKKRGGGFTGAKVHYQVTDITEFILKQNRIEKLFGLAHLVFSGKTTFDAGKHTDQIPPKEVHCIYGIRCSKYREEISLYSKHYLSN